MLSIPFEKSLKEEIIFRRNYLYQIIWQVFTWLFWLFLTISTFFLLLDKKTIWFGILIGIILFSQLKYLNRNRKFLPRNIEKIDNFWPFLSKKSKNILAESYILSSNLPISLSLLKILAHDKSVQELFSRLDIDKEALKKEIKLIETAFYNSRQSKDEGKMLFFKKITKVAAKEADILDEEEIKPYHIFLALLYLEDETSRKMIMHLGLNWQDILSSAQIMVFKRHIKIPFIKEIKRSVVGLSPVKKKIKHRVINRAWTSVNTPFLDNYSHDLTDLAREDIIGFMVGHQKEYSRMVDVLSRDIKNNVLLVGQNGIGKESLIEHLSWQIVNDQVPRKLFDKRVVKVDLSGLLAGAETEGEIRARAEKIIQEILTAKNIILYIPNIEYIFEEGEISILAATFLPYFKKSYFQTICTTSEQGLLSLEKKKDFLDTFEKINVEEIGPLETLRVLILYGVVLEQKNNIEISFLAFRKAIELAKIYSPGGIYPRAAIELLSEAIKFAKNKSLNVLSAETIIEIVERKTNIPLKKVSKIEASKLLNLEEEIHKTFINQEEAVRAVANVLRSYRAGLSSSKGTIANFLFVGPTGVGKTKLSKTLARILFGKEENMIRFDMSKYREADGIKKFIGSNNGQPGELSEAILNKPYSIVLLDEFEKASIEVLNLFLPIFDEGKIKDNLGRVLDFSNSLIIATSNAHSQYIFDSLNNNKPFEKISFDLKNNLLTNDFSPELLNRFNEVVVFKPLGMKEIEKIATLLLKPLENELAEKYRYSFKISESALREIIKEGYSKEFGARPLKHAIEKRVRDTLARGILENNWPPNTNLLLDWQNNQFCVKILPL